MLFIDRGNSRIKWRRAGGVTHVGSEPADLAEALAEEQLIWLSVVDTSWGESLQPWLRADAELRYARSGASFGDLRNGYADAAALGVDRWLALIAARALMPNSPCLLASAGSALTLDFLRADGQHLGGFIVAGRRMQLQALAQVPSLRRAGEDVPIEGYPRATSAALSAGSARMLASFILSEYQDFRDQHPDAKLLLSGGDGEWLLPLLPTALDAMHAPYLVLDGLELYADLYNNRSS